MTEFRTNFLTAARFFGYSHYHIFKVSISKVKNVVTTYGILVALTVQYFPLHAQESSLMKHYLGEIHANTVLSTDSSQVYLLELAKGVNKAALASDGIFVMRDLGNNLIIGAATGETIAKGSNLIHEFHGVNNKWKIAPFLFATDRSAKRSFVISGTWDSNAVAVLRSFQARFLQPGTAVITTTLEKIIDHIVDLPGVNYVGVESLEPAIESRVLELYLGPNTINAVHDQYPSYDGTGMTLSIKENAYDPSDIDLRNRNVPSTLTSTATDNHATDMATIAAGAGNSFVTGKGVAPATNITSSDFSNLFPDDDHYFADLEAWVQNHSYGTDVESFYGALASAYDRQTIEHPDLVHVFSSGNSGMMTPTQGQYAGIEGVANLTGNFKMAKNILTVGSIDTVGRSVEFTSRGPAHDGRIKPEVVAYSTQGTSNSAALVSGVVVLLQQMFLDRFGSRAPAALVKALLINSATDVGTKGPDFVTGFGSVDAYRAMKDLDEGLFIAGSVGHGEMKTYTLAVPEGAVNLKITLVWHDAPASAGSTKALVNDLDLRVDNGMTWYPWVLDSSSDKVVLMKPVERGEDHLNNVEQITIEHPTAGEYQVIVEGHDVPDVAREFFVAYQWDMEGEFTWMSPTASDNVPYNGETGTYFFWRSALPETTGSLEYTVDDGTSWTVLAQAVELGKGYYRWNMVPETNAIAQARMVVGEQVFMTDPFTISKALFPSVGFNCSDSVMIQWPKAAGADYYDLFSLKDGPFVEHVLSTADTFMILSKSGASSPFYSIQPVFNGARLLRCPMFNYHALGTGCFLTAFTSEALPGQGIQLSLQLGTLYGVSRVDFFRVEDNASTLLRSVEPNHTRVDFLDDNPDQGSNRYRATVHLQNGEQVASEELEEYYLTTLPFVVFPNPVEAAGELTIFSKVFNHPTSTFRLYRSDGSLVVVATLTSDREAIPMNNVSPGFYLLTITSEDGIFNGRIVVK